MVLATVGEETITKTYRVPNGNLAKLKEEIARLNARAKRTKCPPIELRVVSYEDRPDPDNELRWIRWHTVVLSGKKPQLAGWVFVATLARTIASWGDEESGAIIRAVPGESVPVEYRTASARCDYCGKARLRRDTFLLRNASGVYAQVGSDCVADFLGGKDPHEVAALAGLWASADEAADGAEDEAWGGGGAGPHLISLKSYLCYVAAAIRQYGWVSGHVARDDPYATSTANRALGMMFPGPGKRPEPYGAEDERVAGEALRWAEEVLRARDLRDLSDYEYNLLQITEYGGIEFRNTGLAASLVPTAHREIAKELERRRLAAVSQWVGEGGKRLELELTLIACISIQTSFGVTRLHRFLDKQGNLLVWFGHGEGATAMREREDYQVRATIKEHSEYNGVRQTVLSRVTLTKKPKTKLEEIAADSRSLEEIAGWA